MKRIYFIFILVILLTGCDFNKGSVKIELNKGVDTIEVFHSWTDSGAKAFDENDQTLEVTVTLNNVDTTKIGTYEVIYQAKNELGRTQKITRKVTVIDETKPVLVLNEGVDTIIVGETWYDSGVTATDNYDGDLTSKVEVTGQVDTSKVGLYTITYKVTDSSGNTSTIKRYVNVIEE